MKNGAFNPPKIHPTVPLRELRRAPSDRSARWWRRRRVFHGRKPGKSWRKPGKQCDVYTEKSGSRENDGRWGLLWCSWPLHCYIVSSYCLIEQHWCCWTTETWTFTEKKSLFTWYCRFPVFCIYVNITGGYPPMNFSLNLERFLEHQAEAGHGISPRTGHLNRMGPVMSFVRMGPFLGGFHH